MIIGLDIYLWYGIYHSKLSGGQPETLKQANRVGGLSGVILSLSLIAIAFIHHHVTNGADNVIFYFSLIFAAAHVVLYVRRMMKK